MWSVTKKIKNSSSVNYTNLVIYDVYAKSVFKRSLSFEQQIITAVHYNDINLLNRTTSDLIFGLSSFTERKGYLTNFADQQIQNIPKTVYSFKKALNPSTFFSDNPHLKVSINSNDFSSIKQLNQRTNGIISIIAAEAINRKNCNEQAYLTHGNIRNPGLAYKQTNQKNCDYYCAKVLYNGKVYNYYADLKVTDKDVFINKVASLHPNKLMLCQVYVIGGLTDSFIFNSHVKNKLITGCQHYMSQHIMDNTPIAHYSNQMIHDLQAFDLNPTLSNYNSIVVAPWRIFSAPEVTKLLNA